VVDHAVWPCVPPSERTSGWVTAAPYRGGVTSWNEIPDEARDLRERVHARFVSAKHHTMATLRRDGSPRISGTEVIFAEGELWLGSMPGARKAQDLQRDGRLALHSSTADETLSQGDARIAGRAEEVTDPEVIARVVDGAEVPPGPMHLFRVDVHEVVLTRVMGDDLVVDSWRAGRGVSQIKRR
jgi:hypothetical protein